MPKKWMTSIPTPRSCISITTTSPPYSVGETRPMRSPGRREIGHGALAERAILPVLPEKDTFPYVVRVVSEVLSSNGSTSMGSVCGSTLSLMDAGVPLKAPVSGAAMGLIKEGRTSKSSPIFRALRTSLATWISRWLAVRKGSQPFKWT